MGAKKLKQKSKKQKTAGRVAAKARKSRSKALVASGLVESGEFGEQYVPTAPPVSTRAPFFASQLKNVCRTTQVGAKCKGPRGVNVKRGELGLDRSGGAEELKEACEAAGHTFVPGRTKAIRAGKMELDFLSPAQAKQLNTLPGPNLRLCMRDDKKGYLVPVGTPDEAVRIANDFRTCVKDSKKNMPKCAADLATATWKGDAPLGALTSRRTFAGLLRGR